MGPHEARARIVHERAGVLMRDAAAAARRAAAMKEDAIDARLRLWEERLAGGVPDSRVASLDRALDAAISVTSADYANIQRLHHGGRGLTLVAHRGFADRFLDFFEFVDDRQTACGLAFKLHRPIIVEDVIRSPIFARTDSLPVILEAGVRAVRSAPLIASTGGVLGVLSVHYREPRRHLDSEVARFQRLAAAVAALIERR